MENRRNFFKAIGLFVGGAIATKVNGMIPKRQEEKDELADTGPFLAERRRTFHLLHLFRVARHAPS